MDPIHSSRPLKSLRRHASFACSILLDRGSTYINRSEKFTSTVDPSVRHSIIELMSQCQYDASRFAHELFDKMESASPDLSADIVEPVQRETVAGGYPSKCVTVLPPSTSAHRRGTSRHEQPTRGHQRRNTTVAKLRRHLHQRSLPTLSILRQTTEDTERPTRRSTTMGKRLTRAFHRKKSSTSGPTTSSSRSPSRASSALNQLSSIKRFIRRPRPTTTVRGVDNKPDLLPLHVQDMDEEDTEYHQEKHEAFPTDRLMRVYSHNPGHEHLDSAYFSQTSRKSLDSYTSSCSDESNVMTRAIKEQARLKPLRTNTSPGQLESFQYAVSDLSPTGSESTVGCLEDFEKSSFAITKLSSKMDTNVDGDNMYMCNKPDPLHRPRRWLSQDIVITEPLAYISPTPEPLRRRYPNTTQAARPKLSISGIETLEIKVYMDQANIADQNAEEALQQIDHKIAESSEFKLFDPLFRSAMATYLEEEDRQIIPTTCRTPRWKHRQFPDIAYTQQHARLGGKWYDQPQTEYSRYPSWMQPSMRGKKYDASLAHLFEYNNLAMGNVARRVLSNQVTVEDGSGCEPLNKALAQGQKMRAQTKAMKSCIADLRGVRTMGAGGCI